VGVGVGVVALLHLLISFNNRCCCICVHNVLIEDTTNRNTYGLPLNDAEEWTVGSLPHIAYLHQLFATAHGKPAEKDAKLLTEDSKWHMLQHADTNTCKHTPNEAAISRAVPRGMLSSLCMF